MTHAYSSLMVLMYWLCYFLPQTNFSPPGWHSSVILLPGFLIKASHTHILKFKTTYLWHMPRAGCQASCWDWPHSFSKYLLPQESAQSTEQHNYFSCIKVSLNWQSGKQCVVLSTELGTWFVLSQSSVDK